MPQTAWLWKLADDTRNSVCIIRFSVLAFVFVLCFVVLLLACRGWLAAACCCWLAAAGLLLLACCCWIAAAAG